MGRLQKRKAKEIVNSIADSREWEGRALLALGGNGCGAAAAGLVTLDEIFDTALVNLLAAVIAILAVAIELGFGVSNREVPPNVTGDASLSCPTNRDVNCGVCS